VTRPVKTFRGARAAAGPKVAIDSTPAPRLSQGGPAHKYPLAYGLGVRRAAGRQNAGEEYF